MLWLQKTLCDTDESDVALWLWCRARQMPNVLIGGNPPGPKSKRREGVPFSTAYGETSCNDEEQNYGKGSEIL
jgi:hypothetical protein